MKIINKNIEHNEIKFEFEEFNYVEQIKNVIKVHKIIQIFIEKINFDSINFSESKNKNIYENFIDYNNFLTSVSYNHYSYILEKKKHVNILY